MENITETGILLLAVLHYNLYILIPYTVYYTYTIVVLSTTIIYLHSTRLIIVVACYY